MLGASGQEITASYISMLRKESNERVPSTDVSRALEVVLDVPKDTLILEAYLDDAPETLLKALNALREVAFEFILRAMDETIPIGELERNLIYKQLEEMALSRFILGLDYEQMRDGFKQNILTSSEQIDDTQLNISMSANVDFPISDVSMQPLLPEGSKAKLRFQEDYHSGEVVAVMLPDEKAMLFRKLYDTKDGKRMLMPLNPAFDVMEYDPASMLIFGRVEAVVTQL